MNDQRPLDEQLRDAYAILNQHGLYDAADYCRRGLDPDYPIPRDVIRDLSLSPGG
jgi:hypothetical protein